MDSAGMRKKRRVGVTATSRWIDEGQETGTPQIVPEMAAPLELRTPVGTVATATIRVRMEAWRQGRGSQLAEESSKEMVEDEGKDRLVGGAPEARMRRCLILRQGTSPLRPPAPFPSGSMFQNGRNLSRVRKPRKKLRALDKFLPFRRLNWDEGKGALNAVAPSRLPLVGPEEVFYNGGF
jgi:hypothetical protein